MEMHNIMSSCLDNTFDFVVSSHCLEHMVDVCEALKNWIRIVKEGGYLIITVPDEDLYEQNQWPSVYNKDHKHTFTIYKSKSWYDTSINVLDLLIAFSDFIEIEKIEKINDFYNFNVSKMDQTLHPNIESCIEIILKKREITPKNLYNKNRYWMPISLPVSSQKSGATIFANFYSKIEYLANLNKNYLLYGYGNVGKLIHKLLANNICGIVDSKSTIIDENINNCVIYSPLNIKNMNYDYIVITPIGRENDIEDYLVGMLFVPQEKIMKLE